MTSSFGVVQLILGKVHNNIALLYIHHIFIYWQTKITNPNTSHVKSTDDNDDDSGTVRAQCGGLASPHFKKINKNFREFKPIPTKPIHIVHTKRFSLYYP